MGCSSCFSKLSEFLSFCWITVLALPRLPLHQLLNIYRGIHHLLGKPFVSGHTYSSKTDADTICNDYHLKFENKVIFLTGCTSGIGKELLKSLVSTHFKYLFINSNAGSGGSSSLQTNNNNCRRMLKHIVICYRSERKLADIKHCLLQSMINVQIASRRLNMGDKGRDNNGNHNVHAFNELLNALLIPIFCDLNDLTSVAQCAQTFLDLELPLHILVNNAGMFNGKLEYTRQGFESQFGVNHLAHFYLSLLLRDVLAKSAANANANANTNNEKKTRTRSRMVNTASVAQVFAYNGISDHEDVINFRKSIYNPLVAYGASKLANVFHAQEFQKRYPKHVLCCSVHPGTITHSGFFRHYIGDTWMLPTFWPISKTAAQGASSVLYAMFDERITGGEYIVDSCAEALPWLSHASDGKMQSKLWEKSLQFLRKSIGFQVAV